jgi:hypothetical protein
MNPPANDEDLIEQADNVVYWNGITRIPLDPERVLKQAKGQLQDVVVMGYTHEGDEYFASSKADGPSILWLLERMKLQLLTIMTETPIE